MRLIEALLRRHIGLNAASIGSALIERAVRGRMQAHGLKNSDTYHDLLATSRQELEQLIEAVVVTETWFFRDQESFDRFTQIALHEWRPRHPAAPLRVLSMPCASGEEPYSLAMALLEAGPPAPGFTIDAVDISALALARAERAVYGKNSFRGRELGFRDRHFLPTMEGYALSPLVRRCVTFEQGNILDASLLAGRPPYDFIFCRNLLIYFDRAMQTLALAKLHRLLADDGLLFVGPAELALVVESGFHHAGLPMAFACRKAAGNTTPAETPPPRPSPATLTETPRQPHTGDPAPPRIAELSSREQVQDLRDPTPAMVDLEIACQHANAGRLAEAAAICDAYLTLEGPAAQAYYLLGLASDASHDPAAITYYRKALYLEPNHYEALTHLTLALEKSGDVGAARIFKRRAERAQPKP